MDRVHVGPIFGTSEETFLLGRLLNKFGLIRVGLEVFLALHFLLDCGWTLHGAQGPLFDLGILPLHIYIYIYINRQNLEKVQLEFEIRI